MSMLDEQALRDLMQRSTADLHAPAGVAAGIAARHRRRTVRRRALGLAVTGAAAGTAFGVIASGAAAPTGSRGPTSASQSGPGIRLTADQITLRHLSTVAAKSSPLSGRYVVMKERQSGGVSRTSVLDSHTGDVWTFQQGPSIPAQLPEAKNDSPTAADFAQMPTSPAALRALLVQQNQQQMKQFQAWERQQLATLPPALAKKKDIAVPVQAGLTDDDIVFSQATDMLWNPLVGPALKAALFTVLEQTPGVQVNPAATDADGRAAVEISRTDSLGETISVYENPATATVLETGGTGPQGTYLDLYLSITSTNTAPTASQYEG